MSMCFKLLGLNTNFCFIFKRGNIFKKKHKPLYSLLVLEMCACVCVRTDACALADQCCISTSGEELVALDSGLGFIIFSLGDTCFFITVGIQKSVMRVSY